MKKNRILIICIICLFITVSFCGILDPILIVEAESKIVRAGENDELIIKLNKTFGGSSVDLGTSGLQTSDGGYIIIGSQNLKIHIIKITDSGSLDFHQTLYDTELALGTSISKTFDGGYIITGYTDQIPHSEDVCLAKISNVGALNLYETYGGFEKDIGNSVQQTIDDGFIITGSTESYGAGKSDVWLIKTDNFGNESWNKTFGGVGEDVGNGVLQTKDGGFIIIGYTESYGAGGKDVLVIKTDSNGNEQWNRTIGGNGNDGGHSIKQTSSGVYILTGSTNSPNFPTTPGAYDVTLNGNNDTFVFKLSTDGVAVVFSTFIGGSNNDWASSIDITSEGNFIITGGTSSVDFPATSNALDISHNGGIDGFLFELTADGSSVKYSTYLGDNGDDFFNSVQQTSDGGFLLTGTTDSYGAGNSDMWLIKMARSEKGYTISGKISGDVQENINISLSASDLQKFLFITDIDGSYEFNVVNGSYTLKPSKAGYTFEPESRIIIINGENSDENNFIATRIISASPIANFTYSPANPTTEDTITLDASESFDPNGDKLTYSWHSNIDGLLGSSKIIKVTLSEGKHSITLNVSDESSFDYIKKYLIVNRAEIRKESGSIRISWQRSTNENFDHYEIYISMDQDFQPSLETLITRIFDRNVTTYTITNLRESITYYGIVREVYKNGTYKEIEKIPAVAVPPESENDKVETPLLANLEYLIVLLLIVIIIIIGLAGYMYRKRKNRRFEEYDQKVNNTYETYFSEPKECRTKLQIINRRIDADVNQGRLNKKQKMIIEDKIHAHLQDINSHILKKEPKKVDSEKSTVQIKNIKKHLTALDQKYEFINRLGAGGFSEVYKAKRKSDGQIVAIKVPFGVRSGEDIDEKVYKSYMKEIRLWKKLSKEEELNDGVIKLYEYGKLPYPWIVMELMKGNLNDKAKKMSINEKLRVTLHMLSVLGKVHTKGIFHRDIKPRNIMFNEEGDWKLGDWGISKEALVDHTTTVGYKGTLAYSAPEQFDPETFGKIDHRTDTYQMGVVAYELFTSKKPFRGKFTEISHKILNEQPTPPNEINTKMPKHVNDAILKALAKHKKNRWQYANDFMRAIRQKS